MAVEISRLMTQGGGHEQHVPLGECQALDQGIEGSQARVRRMHHALGLAGSPGGEDHLVHGVCSATRQGPASRLRLPLSVGQLGEGLHAGRRGTPGHEDALETRQAVLELARHLPVVEAPEGRGNHQRLRFEETQHEAQLARAIGRGNRVDHGSQPSRREEHESELAPVGQLTGDDPARLHTVGPQPMRHPLDGARELGPRVASLPIHHRGLVGALRGPAIEIGVEPFVTPEPRRRAVADAGFRQARLHGELGSRGLSGRARSARDRWRPPPRGRRRCPGRAWPGRCGHGCR